MELIYTDRNGEEQGILQEYSLDLEIGKENDFELVVPASFGIGEGCQLYCYGTEYGGTILRSVSDSASPDITYGGYTWRGMLSKKIIRPPDGQDHRGVSGNVAAFINTFLTETGLQDLFLCDTSDTVITGYQFERYCTLLAGLEKLLKSLSKRLELEYRTDGKVHIQIADIVDHSEELEWSEDCNIQIILTLDNSNPNHLICLGKGELKDREILDLYTDRAGNVSKTQSLFGPDEITEVYDYSGSESLETDGVKKLKEMIREKAELNLSNTEVALHDIVGARDYRSGGYIKREIMQKIIRISKGSTTTEYKVGE